MLDYDDLIIKLETTKKYVARLSRLRDDVKNCVEHQNLDVRVLKIVNESIMQINSLYQNLNNNSDNLDEKSSK